MSDKDLKTCLSEIPQLKGEENLTIWDMMLCDTLDLHGQLKYIKEAFPEPEDKTTEKWAQGHKERTNAICMASDDALSHLTKQYSTISRAVFDCYKRFVTRLHELRMKLSSLGVTMSEKAHILIALNGNRDTYPDDFRFWARDLEKCDLKSDNLMMELSNNAAKDLSNGTFTRLRLTSPEQASRKTKSDSTDQSGQKLKELARGMKLRGTANAQSAT
ncbi:hypothetical protein DL765_002739 [Monosporascus sp. GIB2]|nr:hypothetical protein DL765_002739 [Monosporascus sp. GIB2]